MHLFICSFNAPSCALQAVWLAWQLVRLPVRSEEERIREGESASDRQNRRHKHTDTDTDTDTQTQGAGLVLASTFPPDTWAS